MSAIRDRLLMLLVALAISSGIAALLAATAMPASAAKTAQRTYTTLMPVVLRQKPPAPKSINAAALINQVRSNAGVPRVAINTQLSDNCAQHARYIAVNNHLTHEQNPQLPFASPAGQICAAHSNAWLGSQRPDPGWDPDDSVRTWMTSVGHRLWLLYPTTKSIGYGFHMASGTYRAGAAVDILSLADFAADSAYAEWPVRSPGSGERYVPALRYPITLNWRYFGPTPVVDRTRLIGPTGKAIAHAVSTNLPGGHKGIQLIPSQNLPMNSLITVQVNGRYEGQSFLHEWTFYTGGAESQDLDIWRPTKDQQVAPLTSPTGWGSP